jgi:hypothetical protein
MAVEAMLFQKIHGLSRLSAQAHEAIEQQLLAVEGGVAGFHGGFLIFIGGHEHSSVVKKFSFLTAIIAYFLKKCKRFFGLRLQCGEKYDIMMS